MFNLKTLTKGAAISAVALSVMATTAMAEKVLRIQSVLPNSADEVKMLEAFGKDVADFRVQFKRRAAADMSPRVTSSS